MIAPAARDDRRPALPGRVAGGGNLGRHTPRTDSFVARSAGHRGDSLVDARDVGDVARGGICGIAVVKPVHVGQQQQQVCRRSF